MPPLAGADHFLTDVEQTEAIATFPIGQQRQVLGLLDHLTQRLDGLFKQTLSLFSTVKLPDEPGGSIHQHHRPAFRCIGRLVLVHPRISLISFNQLD